MRSDHQQCFGCGSWETAWHSRCLLMLSCRIMRPSNYFNVNIGGGGAASSPARLSKCLFLAWPPPYDVDLEAAVRWPVRQVVLSNTWLWPLLVFLLSSVRAYVQPSLDFIIQEKKKSIIWCVWQPVLQCLTWADENILWSPGFWFGNRDDRFWLMNSGISEGLPFLRAATVAFPYLRMWLNPQEVKLHLLTCPSDILAHWAQKKKKKIRIMQLVCWFCSMCTLFAFIFAY